MLTWITISVGLLFLGLIAQKLPKFYSVYFESKDPPGRSFVEIQLDLFCIAWKLQNLRKTGPTLQQQEGKVAGSS